ncbi:MAG: hypothetical protein HOB20_16145, partial [Planctomycetaceae bacterium]|nr:hypothetical protein [Planctomycetaceae bacterium]
MISHKKAVLVAVTLVSVCCTHLLAQPTPPAAPSLAERLQIDRYKVNQQRARDLTTDLLSILVDRQMQQLEDNRLTDLPLYEDLKTMRGRMGQLAKSKMPDVIELLVKADIAKPSERQELMAEVHSRMRGILRDLLRERERLRLRRQQAELIERIGEIVIQQKATLDNTLTLSTAQEQLVLSTIDSQKNVAVLVDAFGETLDLVQDWTGELGKLANECKNVLETNEVVKLLKQAEAQLEATDFNDAAKTEKEVVTVLEGILLKIRRFEDPAWIDSDASEAAEDILTAQESLKEELETVDPDDDIKIDELVQAQNLIREKLQRLENLVVNDENAAELIERAQEAAMEAREEIFEGEIEAAMDEQDEIIGTLAELQEQLNTTTNLLDPDLSSEEYSEIADALEEARKTLETADELNNDAEQALADNQLAEAEETEQMVSETTLEAATQADEAGLPEPVAEAIEEAKDSAKEAAEATATANDTKDNEAVAEESQDSAEEAVADAGEDIKEAIGRTSEAEEEARKNALAAKLGELNRAVDTLERAAAEARENAGLLSDNKAPNKQDNEAIKDDFNTTAELAKEIAKGVENLSPEATEQLNNAADKSEQVANAVAESTPENPEGDNSEPKDGEPQTDPPEGSEPANPDKKIPGDEDSPNASETSKPESIQKGDDNEGSPESSEPQEESSESPEDQLARQENAEQAKMVAEELEAAANQIREEVSKTAEELIDELKDQLAGVNDVQESLNSLANAENPTAEQITDVAEETLQSIPDAGNALQQAAESAEQREAGETPQDPMAGDQTADADTPNKTKPEDGESGNASVDENGSEKDPAINQERQLLQAEVLADIKEEKIQQELQMANFLAQLAEQGKESAQELAEMREKLDSDDPHKPNANELFNAVMEQAEALAGIGQLAAEIADQETIANEPIVEASALAEELTQNDPPPEDPQLAGGEGTPGQEPAPSG